MWIRFRLRKFAVVSIFLLTSICGLFLTFKKVFANEQFESTNIRPFTYSGPPYLRIVPALRSDEVKTSISKGDGLLERVCPADYEDIKAFDVNFNVPRLLTFGIPSNGETDTVFLERFRNELSNRGRTIPKVIHFIWNKEIVPSAFVDNLKLFRKMHPSWTINFWTIDAGRRVIKLHEPQLLAVYDHGAKRGVDKADMLRYVVVYHYGGAYFDLDSKVLQPLDELTEQHECLVGPEPVENAVSIMHMRSLLANSGFMCRPRHPFFRHVINMIPFYGVPYSGPPFFTKCFNRFLGNQSAVSTDSSYGITVGPHDFFEFHIKSGVHETMAKLCGKYTQRVNEYLTDCQPLRCDITAIYKQKKSAWEFEACLEWISYEKQSRKPGPGSKRYIEHAHYGTYENNNMDKLVYENENNASLIVPDIVLHI